MLKIGDFSKFSRASVKTLRFYDEIGLLKPISVDQLTGYRYYSVDQLERLNRIISLKDLGFSLEEINEILKDGFAPVRIVKLLQSKYQETLNRMHEEEARLKRVEEWLKKVEKEGNMPDNVVLKKIEEQNVASVRDTIPTYNDIGRLFDELCSYVGRQRVQFIGPPLAIYYDPEYREKNVDVEVAVPVAGKLSVTERIKVHQIGGEDQMACLIHKGLYENFSQSYKALLGWVESHGFQIAGPNREIYLKGPGQGHQDDPSTYITEIQLPVKKI